MNVKSGITIVASSVFVPTKARNSGSRRCRKPLFLLVGGSCPQTPFRRIPFCGCAPFRRFSLPPFSGIFEKRGNWHSGKISPPPPALDKIFFKGIDRNICLCYYDRKLNTSHIFYADT